MKSTDTTKRGGVREDYIVTAITDDGLFRVLAARSTLLVEEARRRHRASKTATAALGRVMTGAALMAATLDDDQSVTVRVLGDGPSGGVIAEAGNADGEIRVRGYLGDPGAELPLTPYGKLDVGGIIGKEGYIHVIKDLGIREQYAGNAKIQSGEIGIDLAYYYTVSEQLPTAISLGVRIGGARKGEAETLAQHTGAEGRADLPELGSGPWVTGSGGLMVQVMPGRDPDEGGDAIDKVQINIDKIGSISQRIREGASPEEMAAAAFAGVSEVRLMNRLPLRFLCKCSRDRAAATLMGLGKQDLLKLSGEQEKTEVRCHFCNEAYAFTAREIGELAAKAEDRPIKEQT